MAQTGARGRSGAGSLGLKRVAQAIVMTESGPVAGIDGAARVFKGIPYAAPPVGELRWRAPQPLEAWREPRDAGEFGIDPLQAPAPWLRGAGIGEDCLTLSVWTPVAAETGSLPVMVWFYGGGFTLGSSSDLRSDGAALARRGVVVVAINYRLGVAGWLAHPGLSAGSTESASGNYGLLDQIAALGWVKRNIAAFGGDPERVTAFGVSAGAACISLLLTSPLAEGLFQQAILQSPGSLRRLATLAEAERGAVRVFGDDPVALRRAPPQALLESARLFGAPFADLDAPRLLRPIVDGWALQGDEEEAWGQGSARALPMLIGSNVEEGAFFLGALPARTLARYRAWVGRNFGAMADEALALYPVEDDAAVAVQWTRLFGDHQFNRCVRRIAALNALREPRTFRYLFAQRPGARTAPPTHADEVEFVFGTPNATRTNADRKVSDAMLGAWVSFATHGDPNGAGLPRWPAYEGEADGYLEFGDSIQPGSRWRARELTFLERHFEAQRRVSPQRGESLRA